ncbi:17235_t:CDS:2 [Cetraspora pellucida]|uniref:17235_t:CDS:1 n=1 Tax=Cetraspora pellucida TaxID=1433469 RepID=A0A9N9G0Y1_9GLOM|nr:17235_t:CDS:2 [Cetraspora pellucida]
MSFLFNDPFFSLYDPYFDSGIRSPRTSTFDWTPDTSWSTFSIGPETPTWDQTTSRTLDTAPRSRNSLPISDQSRNVGSRIKVNKMGDVVWRPATDIYDTNDAFIIHIDLPGVPKEDISIDLRNVELTIQGESKRKPAYEAATSRVRERRVGKFRKVVFLPRDCTLKRDNIEANFQNGLLEIKVPRSSADKDSSKIVIQ